MESIIANLGEWGLAGILAASILWLIWYRETVAMPKLLERFSNELRTERDTCEKRHAEILAAMREHRVEIASGFKEQWHALRDLAHAAGIREAVREALGDAEKGDGE